MKEKEWHWFGIGVLIVFVVALGVVDSKDMLKTLIKESAVNKYKLEIYCVDIAKQQIAVYDERDATILGESKVLCQLAFPELFEQTTK